MRLKFNIGFGGLLTILFVGLKLASIITWSWIWVLSPLWIGFAITGLIWAFIFAMGVLAIFFGSR